jgi:uncharacterized protein YbjT (DUF2867 family)
MHIITGGTGRVGSALAEALLKKGEQVTIISRSSKRAKEWMSKGAQFAVADIYDTVALHEIFKKGKSIFILNPPADPMTDTPVQERKTVASLHSQGIILVTSAFCMNWSKMLQRCRILIAS